jgi:hypothetical protein
MQSPNLLGVLVFTLGCILEDLQEPGPRTGSAVQSPMQSTQIKMQPGVSFVNPDRTVDT